MKETMKQPRMHKILEKAFPGLKIKDAPKDLRLFPTELDFKNAVRKDPEHCGFANCAARVCGSTQAHFFTRYAYIDHPGDDGVRRVYRYCISKDVHDAIADFDEFGVRVGKKMRAFTLRAPKPSEKLEAQRKANRKWRTGPTAKAITAEKAARVELRRCEREFDQATLLARDTNIGTDKVRENEARVRAARLQTRKAKEKLAAAVERAKKARLATYGTGKAKPRLRNLAVRSGSGAWFRALAEKRV